MFEFRANERQKKGERWQMVNEKVRAERKRAEGRGRPALRYTYSIERKRDWPPEPRQRDRYVGLLMDPCTWVSKVHTGGVWEWFRDR